MKPLYQKHIILVIIILSILIPLILMMPSDVYSANAMADYCYMPPFVMDPATPPNVIIVYEKGADIAKRAHQGVYVYNPDNLYYGYFDSDAYYTFSPGVKKRFTYFQKLPAACTPPITATGVPCISGDVLNYALMSSLDLSRKTLVGYGWPKASGGDGAGDVFTYTGCFINGGTATACEACADISNPPAGCQIPLSMGQWEDGNTLSVPVLLDLNGDGTNDLAYSFCLGKAAGNDPTSVAVNWETVGVPLKPPPCVSQCANKASCKGDGLVQVLLVKGENRSGLIQEFADIDQDYIYNSDAIRFGKRRWKASTAATDRNRDIQCDDSTSGSCTSTDKTYLLREIINALSKEPMYDTGTNPHGEMMEEIIKYFKEDLSANYTDKDSAYTQTPYDWSYDPGSACRKTVVLYMSTGANLGGGTPLDNSCSSGIDSTNFSMNTCYANTVDLSVEEGDQNIQTWIAHTTFYGAGGANKSKLVYATEGVGGGGYVEINNPSDLEQRLRELFENVLASATSASTVATLTTQTRESSTLTQAYFYPKLSDDSLLRWIGYLRLLWSDTNANLREDTDQTIPGELDVKKDEIISFFFDETADPPQYKANLYDDIDGDLTIDSCDAGITEKTNTEISSIWEAQSLLFSRDPDETLAAGVKRDIKIAFDSDNNDIVTSTEIYDFTTAMKATLRPYWDYGSECSNDPTRTCSVNSDCAYCIDTAYPATDPINLVLDDLGCSAASDCYYCNMKTEQSCSVDADCVLSDNGYCNDLAMLCSDGSGPCAVGASLGDVCGPLGLGFCEGQCSLNAGISCTADIQCSVDYGPCIQNATITCNSAGVTCLQDCDLNCAESVIKYIRGYDKPSPSGADFRTRHDCGGNNSNCPLGETCDPDSGICSGSDIEKTNKLGDIVYSTPRLAPDKAVNGYDARYGDTTYTTFINNTIRNELPLVIVGANDGMVHAFKVGKIKDIKPATANNGGKQVAQFLNMDDTVPTDLGKELWTFIPYNAMPYLRWYCDANYCHIPMVDARFTIIDASIGAAADVVRASDGSSWKRLLIGVMGIGGTSITMNGRTFSSSIFVMDITDTESPSLIWERKMPDNTLTTSNPAIVRLGARDKNGDWYVVIGSGPESISTTALNFNSSNARIYAFNLRDGSIPAALLGDGINLGVSGVAVGDIMATDLDGDYQVDDLYFGTFNNSDGNFYRLRIRNSSAAGDYDTDPANWDLSTVINVGRPIFASPEISVDSKRNIWLYFGTGLFLTLEHTIETTEYIYGVKEPMGCWTGDDTSACTFNNFFITRDTALNKDIKFINAKATNGTCYCSGSAISNFVCLPAGICPANPCGIGTNQDAIITKVTDAVLTGSGTGCDGKTDKEALNCLADEIDLYDGWRREVLTGPSGSEVSSKTFAKPFVGQGLVNMTAYHPTTTPCSLGGETYLMTLHYTTGTAYFQPTIIMTGGTSGAYSSLAIEPTSYIGKGVPPLGESIIGLPLPGDSYKVITQVSGALPGTTLSPSEPAKRGYLLWLTK